eukprot:5622400-Prymnesium_polylepis.1
MQPACTALLLGWIPRGTHLVDGEPARVGDGPHRRERLAPAARLSDVGARRLVGGRRTRPASEGASEQSGAARVRVR